MNASDNYCESSVETGEVHGMENDLVIVGHVVFLDIHRLDEVVTALVLDQFVHDLPESFECLVPLPFPLLT